MRTTIVLILLCLSVSQIKSYTTTKTDLTGATTNVIKTVTAKGSNFFISGTTIQKGITVFDTKIADISDFDCYEHINTCIIVANLQASVLTWEGEEFKIQEITHKANGSVFPTEFITMKTAAVHKTDYFLAGISTTLGLTRWKLGIFESYSSLDLSPSFTSQDKFLRDIFVVKMTPLVLISVYGHPGIAVVDFTLMTLKTYLKDVPSGMLALLEKELNLTKGIVATGNKLVSFNYSTGTLITTATKYYFISAIATILESDYIITAEDSFVRIYDGSGTMATSLYSYEMPSGIKSLNYNFFKSEILVGGFKFASTLKISSPSLAECHQNCNGGCL